MDLDSMPVSLCENDFQSMISQAEQVLYFTVSFIHYVYLHACIQLIIVYFLAYKSISTSSKVDDTSSSTSENDTDGVQVFAVGKCMAKSQVAPK